MSLIPQVKCGRCDRTYSGLRSRCPYCGARRHKKGKRVSDGDNATWKLIIGILLIVVLIAAVVVILVTGSSDKEKEEPGNTKPSTTEGVNTQSGTATEPGDTTAAEIAVTLPDGSAVSSVTVKTGEAVQLTASVTPASITDKPVWTSSDETIAKVEAVDETGMTVQITGGAVGAATVTVTAGDAKAEISVTCSETGTEPITPPSTPIVATAISAKSRYQNPVKDFTASKIGEVQPITVILTPSNATGVPVWTSSNTDVMEVTPTDETGLKANVTCVGKGTAKITVTIDNISYEFLARGPKK